MPREIDVCIWRMFVFMSVVVIVLGSVGMFVVCFCKGCDGCCVFVCIVTRGAVSARVWEVRVFRHANVVCLCLVCILWEFTMLHTA